MRTTALAVVVPARDEERCLPRCLSAITQAADLLAERNPEVQVSVTVALDRCTDGSGRVVRNHHGVGAVAGDFGSVGRARDEGIRYALEQFENEPGYLWVANTDADTCVPRNWLAGHHALAQDYDLVLGSVEPRWEPWERDSVLAQAWATRHRLAAGHAHIHGANLGFRASSYLEAGGFSHRESGEDVELVERLKARGARWCAVDSVRALTSARTRGRAPAGFADYLRRLGAETRTNSEKSLP